MSFLRSAVPCQDGLESRCLRRNSVHLAGFLQASTAHVWTSPAATDEPQSGSEKWRFVSLGRDPSSCRTTSSYTSSCRSLAECPRSGAYSHRLVIWRQTPSRYDRLLRRDFQLPPVCQGC